ncbi:MAG: TRAM domain-containing protein, partial [Akkermansiaceae bacterium]|nr:TRAM domain-containing protein [Armatimonadota bacterium]
KLPDQIPHKEKIRRLELLIARINDITCEINARDAASGKTFEVLVDGRSHKAPDQWQGQTRGGKTVHFTAGRELTGQTVQVRPVSSHLWGFQVELV